MEELTYEGYAPGGIAVLVEVMTDNRNRTVADVRHAFTKRSGSLGTDGSVAYLFTRKGRLSYRARHRRGAPAGTGAGDRAGCQLNDDGSADVVCAWEDFGAVKGGLEAAGLVADDGEVTMIASTTGACRCRGAEMLMGLVEALEDLDDVQNVYTNVDIPEEGLVPLML